MALEGVLGQMAKIGAIIGAIVMVVYLIKAIFDYVKGDGNVGKIVVAAIVMLFLIGLMVVASNIVSIQGSMGEVANSAVDVVQGTATDVLSG